MAKNRLFVDEIVSIGLVESPDNPGAEVLIYKAKAAEPWSLAKSQKRLEEIKKEHRQRVDQIEARGKEPRKMSMTEAIDKHYHPKPDGTFSEEISKALDGFVSHLHINADGRGPFYGAMQKTAAQLRAIYWQTDDGRALTALDREYGGMQADEVLTKVQKSGEHAAGFAALAGLSQ